MRKELAFVRALGTFLAKASSQQGFLPTGLADEAVAMSQKRADDERDALRRAEAERREQEARAEAERIAAEAAEAIDTERRVREASEPGLIVRAVIAATDTLRGAVSAMPAVVEVWNGGFLAAGLAAEAVALSEKRQEAERLAKAGAGTVAMAARMIEEAAGQAGKLAGTAAAARQAEDAVYLACDLVRQAGEAAAMAETSARMAGEAREADVAAEKTAKAALRKVRAAAKRNAKAAPAVVAETADAVAQAAETAPVVAGAEVVGTRVRKARNAGTRKVRASAGKAGIPADAVTGVPAVAADVKPPARKRAAAVRKAKPAVAAVPAAEAGEPEVAVSGSKSGRDSDRTGVRKVRKTAVPVSAGADVRALAAVSSLRAAAAFSDAARMAA
jgi:hypothetical protein